MAATVDYLLADVFARTPYEGNPLAVAIDPPPLDDRQMQRVAAELNLSETIFLSATATPGEWSARIFTPSVELPFAGHPTVGAAVALALTGRVDGDAITLVERAGPVRVTVAVSGDLVGRARFVGPQPARKVVDLSPDDAAATIASLGLEPDDASPELPAGVWTAGVPFTVVPLRTVDALGRATPDAATGTTTLTAVEPAFYLVAPTDDLGGHWRARMFAPALGIAEDPATGAAACAFAGLVATTAFDGPAAWTVEQGVEMGRRSVLRLDAQVADGSAGHPGLAGDAVLVGRGELTLASL